MKVFSKQEIHSSLESKGFTQHSTHHQRYFFDRQGVRGKITTKVSHGSGGDDVPKNIAGKMAKQLHLSNSQFVRFINCPIDQNEYEKILTEKGILPDPTPEEDEPIPENMYDEIYDRMIELVEEVLQGAQHREYGKLWGRLENDEFTVGDIERLEELEDSVDVTTHE